MAIQSRTIPTTMDGQPIFICPGSPATKQEHAITCMIFCNPSDLPIKLDLYYVTSSAFQLNGGVIVPDTFPVVHQLEIPSTETFSFDTEKVILESGDIVYAMANDSGLVVTISSMRVS